MEKEALRCWLRIILTNLYFIATKIIVVKYFSCYYVPTLYKIYILAYYCGFFKAMHEKILPTTP